MTDDMSGTDLARGLGALMSTDPKRRDATNEMVPFKLIQCPECKHQLCWVNPRLPSHCPECGARIWVKLKAGNGIVFEATAWLRIEGSATTKETK